MGERQRMGSVDFGEVRQKLHTTESYSQPPEKPFSGDLRDARLMIVVLSIWQTAAKSPNVVMEAQMRAGPFQFRTLSPQVGYVGLQSRSPRTGRDAEIRARTYPPIRVSDRGLMRRAIWRSFQAESGQDYPWDRGINGIRGFVILCVVEMRRDFGEMSSDTAAAERTLRFHLQSANIQLRYDTAKG